MAESDRNIKERRINTDSTDKAGDKGDNNAHGSASKRKGKNDNPYEFYIALLILGGIFIFGFVCGKYFGNIGSSHTEELSNADIDAITTLLKDKHEKGQLHGSDLENWKKLVQVLERDAASSSKSKDISQMSHEELMETLAKPANPNALRDLMLEKIYIFLFIVFVLGLLVAFALITSDKSQKTHKAEKINKQTN